MDGSPAHCSNKGGLLAGGAMNVDSVFYSVDEDGRWNNRIIAVCEAKYYV